MKELRGTDLGTDQDMHDQAVDHDPTADQKIDGKCPRPGRSPPALGHHKTQGHQCQGQDIEIGAQTDCPCNTQRPHPPRHGMNQTSGQQITFQGWHGRRTHPLISLRRITQVAAAAPPRRMMKATVSAIIHAGEEFPAACAAVEAYCAIAGSA